MDVAKKGQEVCVKIEPIPGESPKMYGRHFEATDILVSKVSPSAQVAIWRKAGSHLLSLHIYWPCLWRKCLNLLLPNSPSSTACFLCNEPCEVTDDEATCSSWAFVGYSLSCLLCLSLDLADQPAVHRRPERLVSRRDAEERLAAYCGAEESIWNHLIFPHGAGIGVNARKTRQNGVDVSGHWCT